MLVPVPLAAERPRAADAVSGGHFSPDGNGSSTRPCARFRSEKRYQGGWAKIFYHLRLAIPRSSSDQDPRTDRDPMWIGNAIISLGSQGLFKFISL